MIELLSNSVQLIHDPIITRRPALGCGVSADCSSPAARHRAAANRKDSVSSANISIGARNLVERFFNRIKHFRRIASRYDKLAENFLAALKLAAPRIWLRDNESTSEYDRPCRRPRAALDELGKAFLSPMG